jgi:hypothetical protein
MPRPSLIHWVDQSLTDGCGGRDSKWTRSIAVGSKEPDAGYRADISLEKNDIGVENACSWNNTLDISTQKLGPTLVGSSTVKLLKLLLGSPQFKNRLCFAKIGPQSGPDKMPLDAGVPNFLLLSVPDRVYG